MLPALMRSNSRRQVRKKRGGGEGESGRQVGSKGSSDLSSSRPQAGPTCGGHSSEVVRPAEHHSGPVAGALNQRPGQG